MWRRALVLSIAGFGCDRVFQLDSFPPDARVIDASHRDAPGDACGFGDFDAAVPLSSVPTAYDPFLDATLLQLFFVQGTTGDYDLWVATRDTPGHDFGNPRLLTEINSASEDTDPSITSDDLRLFFRSDRPSKLGDVAQRVYETSRKLASDPFGPATIPAGLEMVDTNSLNVSPDGLTVYVVEGAELRQFSRAGFDLPFTEDAASPLGVDMPYPSLSPDGLEVFFDGNGVSRATRPSRATTFGPAAVFDTAGSDPGFSADDRTLVIVYGSSLGTRTRHCL